jgi:hypothetical protein
MFNYNLLYLWYMGLPIPIFVSVIPSNPNPMAMHFPCAKNRQIPVPILPLHMQDPLAKNKVPERNEFGKLFNLLMGCYRPAGTRALYKGVS